MSNGNGGKAQNGLHDLYGFLSAAGGLLVIGALAFGFRLTSATLRTSRRFSAP